MFHPVPDEDASVDNKTPSPKQMSATALESVNRGICCGVIRSLVAWLFNHEAEKDDVRKKVLTFTNAMLSNKDISDYESEYLSEGYINSLMSLNYAVDPSCSAPCCSDAYLSWYTVISNIIDDTQCWTYSFDPEKMKTLNEHERAIVTNLKELSEQYYKARDTFENYFREVNKRALARILVKYGTTLSTIAPEWYKDVCRAAGVTTNKEELDSPR